LKGPVHYIPVVTTLFSIFFFMVVLQRWLERGRKPHLGWWAAGVLIFGAGTFTEALTTLFGWKEPVFRVWYIVGALLGGAPLAQGTVYLLLRRRTANVLAALLVTLVAIASVCVLVVPIEYSLVEPHRLTGKVMRWYWVRLFSPVINLYALTFLVGGAAYSAWRYANERTAHHRVVGNTLIAVGALLPGIGGTFTRFGMTEVLYVTELLGLVTIYLGYRWTIRTSAAAEAAAPLTAAGSV